MNIRDLDLNLLLVFEAIFATGNISKAAKQLDLSQPAMSNALARLRKQVDDPLFVRDGNGVIPTTRAENMIESVRVALGAIRQSMGDDVGFDPRTSKRHFRMIVADPLEGIIVPNLLTGITGDTQITFELLPPQLVQIEDALIQDKIDLAVFLMPARVPGLISEPLCPVNLVALARNKHPRIYRTLTQQQLLLENHVVLTLAAGKLSNSEKLTFWHQLNLKAVCQVYKVSSIAQIVSKSDLVGLVPKIYADQIADTYRLQVLELDFPISNQHFQLIWHKRQEADEGHIWLRNKILNQFKSTAI